MERNILTTDQEKWLQALESGEYSQTTNTLVRENNEKLSYCCLGVACLINGLKAVDRISDYVGKEKVFEDSSGNMWCTGLPTALRYSLQLHSKNRSGVLSPIQMNDIYKMSFKEIAERIRKQPWNYFTNFDKPEEVKEENNG